MNKTLFNNQETLTKEEQFSVIGGSGATSAVTFDAKDFWEAVLTMFHVKEDEKLLGVTITDNGIKASFAYRK